VKLTDRYAKVLSKASEISTDWIGRKGKVLFCDKETVAILWEGRKSRDYVPHKGVELVRSD
jgi:hypothetical protein